MAFISNRDKKVWNEYISNFDKFPLFTKELSKLDTNFLKKNTVKSFKSFDTKKACKRMKVSPDRIIDLHGYNLYNGKIFLQKCIINSYEKNVRSMLVITGKGLNNKGALKEEVPKWLSEKFIKKFLIDFNIAPRNFGGEGALLIRIKNKYKK